MKLRESMGYDAKKMADMVSDCSNELRSPKSLCVEELWSAPPPVRELEVEASVGHQQASGRRS